MGFEDLLSAVLQYSFCVEAGLLSPMDGLFNRFPFPLWEISALGEVIIMMATAELRPSDQRGGWASLLGKKPNLRVTLLNCLPF